jgi:hypothetical protein
MHYTLIQPSVTKVTKNICACKSKCRRTYTEKVFKTTLSQKILVSFLTNNDGRLTSSINNEKLSVLQTCDQRHSY